MSAYRQQEYDFINRTKYILVQYDNLDLKEKFEVTLFLNCLVGLLILPQQYWFNEIPDDPIDHEDWGIHKSDITFIKQDEKITVKNVARHLRNSLAHYKFQVFANNDQELEIIKVEDFDPARRKTFEMEVSIEQLKSFTEKLTTFLLHKMQDAQ